MLNKDKQVFIQAPYAKDKCLYYFEAVVLKERQVEPSEPTTISLINTLKDYTIWHRRLGHANPRVIKQLPLNTKGALPSIQIGNLPL